VTASAAIAAAFSDKGQNPYDRFHSAGKNVLPEASLYRYKLHSFRLRKSVSGKYSERTRSSGWRFGCRFSAPCTCRRHGQDDRSPGGPSS